MPDCSRPRQAALHKPTVREFVDKLGPAPTTLSVFRTYYCTLRRRGLGQTCALIGALLALDYSQAQIAVALCRSLRRVSANWARIRDRFGLEGIGSLVRFLLVPDACAKCRRSKPTPQQRPFPRPSSADAAERGA